MHKTDAEIAAQLWQTRTANEQRLLSRRDEIARGAALDVLTPFAKAYYGLYCEVDTQRPPRERVVALAGEPLAAAIFDGLVAALWRDDLPDTTACADALVAGSRPPVAHVVLAGMAELYRRDPARVLTVPAPGLQSACCAWFALAPSAEPDWLAPILVQRPDIVRTALASLWACLLAQGYTALPGVTRIFTPPVLPDLAGPLALDLLQRWPDCGRDILPNLLLVALRHGDQDTLRRLTELRLNALPAAGMHQQVLWQAARLLLAPAAERSALEGRFARSRERLVPVLELVAALVEQPGHAAPLRSAALLATLLRVLGPVFLPHHDHVGELCDASRDMLRLFHALALSEPAEAQAAVQRLRALRVLRLYAPVLDEVARLAQQRQAGQPAPDYAEFIATLQADPVLRGRRTGFEHG